MPHGATEGREGSLADRGQSVGGRQDIQDKDIEQEQASAGDGGDAELRGAGASAQKAMVATRQMIYIYFDEPTVPPAGEVLQVHERNGTPALTQDFTSQALALNLVRIVIIVVAVVHAPSRRSRTGWATTSRSSATASTASWPPWQCWCW